MLCVRLPPACANVVPPGACTATPVHRQAPICTERPFRPAACTGLEWKGRQGGEKPSQQGEHTTVLSKAAAALRPRSLNVRFTRGLCGVRMPIMFARARRACCALPACAACGVVCDMQPLTAKPAHRDRARARAGTGRARCGPRWSASRRRPCRQTAARSRRAPAAPPAASTTLPPPARPSAPAPATARPRIAAACAAPAGGRCRCRRSAARSPRPQAAAAARPRSTAASSRRARARCRRGSATARSARARTATPTPRRPAGTPLCLPRSAGPPPRSPVMRRAWCAASRAALTTRRAAVSRSLQTAPS